MRPLSKSGASVAAVVCVLLLASGVASAETWTLLWNEDFNDVSDWALAAHFTAAGGLLKFAVDAGTVSTWWGPTYRSAGSSTWDDLNNPILNISIDDLLFEASGSGSANRAFAFVLESSTASPGHVPDATDNQDWFEFRLQDAPCCAVIRWTVFIRDDGVTTEQDGTAIAEFQGFPVDANVTINTNAKRYWINWTVVGRDAPASYTNTWSGDGPFAESDSHRLSLWGYSNYDTATFPLIDLANLAVYTNQTGAPAAVPPPPPPTPHGKVHGDFLWSNTTFGVQFHDRSNAPGRLVGWRWDFDDGFGARSQNPLHDFPCRGNFTVTLYLTDEYGNTGNVTKHVLVKNDSPTCGILARYEGGLEVNTPVGWLNIPQTFFLVLLVVSGVTILAGVEFPIISMRVRKLLFVLSLVMTLITFGALSWIT